MTESFKQQLQELIDQAAVRIVAKMYDVSNEQAQNFPSEIYTVKQGCEFLMPVLMKAVEQRNQNAYGYPEDENKELLNILKGNK